MSDTYSYIDVFRVVLIILHHLHFLFSLPRSPGRAAPSLPPPGAVKVQLSLTALCYPSHGGSGVGLRGAREEAEDVGVKTERSVWDDILEFLGRRGCISGLLEQVSSTLPTLPTLTI